jgi:hypothetical protein
MQNSYTTDKLNVVLLSTDASQAMYDRRAPSLFEKYGGDSWPSAVLPNAFNDTARFGGFGYGKVIVDEEGIVRSVNEYDFENQINQIFLLGTLAAKNKAECEAAGGYWYNDKAWRHYEEEGIANDDIDRLVKQQLDVFRASTVAVDGESFPIQSLDSQDHQRGTVVTVNFNNGEEIRMLIDVNELENGPVTARAKCFRRRSNSKSKSKGRLIGVGDVTVQYAARGAITVKGNLERRATKKADLAIEFLVHKSFAGLGASELLIEGNEALLSGTLGSVTYEQVKNLLANHPEVKTITFTEVEGSVNDEANMHTGRIIREAGLNTRLLPDSEIASGGVDLFCAGVKRSIADGAKLGVHSWSDGVFDGLRYPEDHPAHQYQLEYFTKMLGADHGPKFYFYTLSAAAADNIHWMSQTELQQWRIATQ